MRTTLRNLSEQAKEGGLPMVTAYDYPMAYWAKEAGLSFLLVGDSLGMVVQGKNSTVSVTLDEMVYHTQMVRRGAPDAFVVTDLPFMSYQTSPEDALRAAGRLMKEADCDAVKLEGGCEMAPTISRLVAAGIPVMGHVGFTPQSVSLLSGFRVQANRVDTADQLFLDVLTLEKAGAFGVVLEMIPYEVAREIVAHTKILTIGIGAGPFCHGQVLVSADLLGVYDKFKPRFARRYTHLGEGMKEAFARYAADVKTGHFPNLDESFSWTEAEPWAPKIPK